MPKNDPENLLSAGTLLDDKWVIMELLGRGAFGEVYRAQQLNLKRDVAIKIVSPEMSALLEENSEEIENTLHRFQREVQSMAQVRHPNILHIIDHGATSLEKEGKSIEVEYIVMEYIPGATLRYSMSEEGFDNETDLIYPWLKDYFLPMLNGVEAIHAAGIVHRDLKPENVLLDGKIPKIADFGLARSQAIKPITGSMDMKGTMMYMAPEQFMDFRKADRQADIYSLGKILFEALSGKIEKEILPFKQVALTEAKTPFLKSLDRVIQHATHEDKQSRFQSITELQSAVAAALEIYETEDVAPTALTRGKQPVFQHSKWVWAGIILAVVAVGGMAIWHLIGKPETSAPVASIQKTRTASQTAPGVDSAVQKNDLQPPPKVMLGKDGIQMKLIPAGSITSNKGSSKDQEKTIDIKAFYLDTVKVTNLHFVEFLNAVIDTLTIESKVVKQNDYIWLYLGQENEPSTQIIFQHNRFHIQDPEKASFPITRVTGYGAMAYARHYGKRLPTAVEWKYAYVQEKPQESADLENQEKTEDPRPGKSAENTEHHMNMETLPEGHEMNKKNNLDSIKGGERLKEWVVSNTNHQTAELEIFAIGPFNHPGSSEVVSRHPWEAFDDVSFKCVSNVSL